MTLGTTPPINDYIENGVTLVHPVDFQFELSGDLVCSRIVGGVETVQTLGADYNVAGGGGAAGSVTKTSGGTIGTIFRIRRRTTRGQPTDFTAHDNFPAEVVETSLDRLASVNPEQDIDLLLFEGRTVRFPVGETTPELPLAADRKGKLFGFDAITGVRALFTMTGLATLLSPLLSPLLAAIQKGDPGGNIMAIGLFLAGPTLSIAAGTNVVRTSGYSIESKGGAFYQYDAAVDAAYVIAHPRTSFRTTNGRGFRLSLDQVLNVQMFGAVGDNATNDGAAFVTALAFVAAAAQAGFGFGSGAPRLRVPLGAYFLDAQTLDFTCTTVLEGDGIGSAGGGASVLRWGPNTTGLRFQRSDTSGAAGTGATGLPGSDGSIVRGLLLQGAYAGAESEAHGIHIRSHGVCVEQCLINNFEGDGIHINTLVGGNANCFAIARSLVINCRNGIYTVGGNSNAGSARDIDVSLNRQWGIWDDSFLGNTYHGIAENCGVTVGALPSVVSYAGNRYAVVVGQEVGASTNAPSGTTADNSWWYFTNAGAPEAGKPAWVNGMTLRAGGPIRTSNNNARNVISGFYTEFNQGPMQLVWPTLLLGGAVGSGVRGVSWLRHSDTSLLVDSFHVLGNTVLGPANNDPPADATTWFATTNSFYNCLFGHWTDAAHVTYGGAIQSQKNVAFRIIGNPVTEFYAGDPGGVSTYAGKVTVDGFDLLNKLSINGEQVLSNRTVAIPNVAGGATVDAETRATVNGILAALRHHGLIAP